MTIRRTSHERLCVISLFAVVAMCLRSPCFAQDLAVNPVSNVALSRSSSVLQEEELHPRQQGLAADLLPDAPMPANQTQGQTRSGQKLNQLAMLPPKRLRTNFRSMFTRHLAPQR
jgi:hypothetical protein